MIVAPDSELIGQTIEKAGLRGLKGVYLIELIRQQTKIGNVRPDFILQPEDRLIFSGNVSSISDLGNLNGLKHPEQQVYKLEETINTQLMEVIVTASNSMVGHTIRESNFRKQHQSVIIAVIRNGQRIDKKTGDIEIHAGDLLLLQASNQFAQRHKYSRDFLILHGGTEQQTKRSSKAIYAWASLIGVVFLAAFNIVHIVVAAFMGVILTLVSGCLTTSEASKTIDFKVLALIVFAFGFGEAIKHSGLAHELSEVVLSFKSYGPFALLISVYLMTLVLTEFVTNNAAAIIVFSLVAGIVNDMSFNIIPFAVAIMIAASASFITPLGYQTNLMVYSAGNYRFSDYFKLGLPMSLVVMLTL
jgi:di/tricarboxylate transporter